MEKEDYDFHKMDAFVKKNFKYTDGKSTDRVIDQLIIGGQAGVKG
jgi:CDP-ribitol ribitolphosphotransferase